MKKIFLSFAAILVTGLTAHAHVEVLGPVKAETEIKAWNDAYGVKVAGMKDSKTYPNSGYTECRETAEIKSGWLCLSNTQKGMNSTLARATFFVEGTAGPEMKKKIVRQDSPFLARYKVLFGGHDLRGGDLIEFYNAVETECKESGNDVNICMNAYEKDVFENFLIPRAKADPNFAVITFANVSGMTWQDAVSHEIMHVQYFNQPAFRAVADAFWANDVSAEHKVEIKRQLAPSYDENDELLMMNEFQAYMLMAGAEDSQLSEFVGIYRDLLMKRMLEAGVTPVQVK